MKKFALFKGHHQISKAHSTKDVVVIEAFEKGCVIDYGGNFYGENSRQLIGGIKIKEIKE